MEHLAGLNTMGNSKFLGDLTDMLGGEHYEISLGESI